MGAYWHNLDQAWYYRHCIKRAISPQPKEIIK